MKKLVLIVCLILGFLFLFPSHSSAQTAQSGSNVTLEKNQTINGDYFASGKTVSVDGTVNGDIYAMGGNIQINGTVNGDVLVAGGNILIQGTVHNIRVLGGQVTISAATSGNVSIAGGNVTIMDNAKIGGSLVVAGGQVNALGPITKGATLAGGQVTIGNYIGSNVLAAGMLTLSPSATIHGNLTYWSSQKARLEQGAKITGTISQHITQQKPASNMGGVIAGIAITSFLVNLISAFILGIIFVKLFPIFMSQITEVITVRPWVSMGVGFISAIAIPVICVILFVSVVGFPLGFLLLVIYGIYVYIAKIFIALAIGSWIFRRSKAHSAHLIWALLIGLVIYSLLGFIPIIGWIIGCLFWLMGFGGLLIAKRNTYLAFRAKKLI